jgi:two-component system, response regulator PdtaR
LSDIRPLVLVAEDEPLASLALRAQLEVLGYRVLTTHDGEEAVAMGACFPVDICLFDFRMPRRTGLDAARALFELAPTPVVLLSGFDPFSMPEPIPRPPIFASITKPADLRDLRAALDEAAKLFESWVNAEPERRRVVDQRKQERATIASAVAALAGDGAQSPVAERLLRQAASEQRPLIDIARQTLQPE